MSQLEQPIDPGIRVLISDADRMSAQLIGDELMRGRNNLVVAGIAANSTETVREIEKHQPDIALINAHLEDGRMKGYHALQYVRLFSPKTVAIMLIPGPERDLVVNAFRGGARGVFCRLQSIKLLPKCIRTVHEGQIWADTRNLAFILDFLTVHKPLRLIKPGGGIERLTPREEQVVHLLADGLSTSDIGQKLELTEHTIRNYLSTIYDKLGVSSRVELALYAVTREDLGQRVDELPNGEPPKKTNGTSTRQRAKSASTA
jgi:two-component system nitrate/nitrite response regulator NarL